MSETEKTTGTLMTEARAAGPDAAAARQKIVAWLKTYLANLTEIDIDEIDVHSTFDRYGFDSYQGVVMTFELGEWIGSEIDPSDTFDHPSVAELADYLAADPKHQAALAQQP